MRKGSLGGGEYYHIYNRGVEKRRLFLDDNDHIRFLTLLLFLQGRETFPQIGRLASTVKHLMFDRKELDPDAIALVKGARMVEVVCFILMENHFHILLRDIGDGNDGNIPKFMQRLGNAYAKYFNTKYGRTGHLFENRYNAIHVDSNEYLNYLSAYIHLNISENQKWGGKEEKYPWSSFQDIAIHNRFDDLLLPAILLEQFPNENEYKMFVKNTPIKKLNQLIMSNI
jgi:REP element-mobilizing transposase RayT